MAHQCHATALRCAAEESNLDFVLPELLRVLDGCRPGCGTAGVLVVLKRGEVRTETSISLDDATETDLKKRNK